NEFGSTEESLSAPPLSSVQVTRVSSPSGTETVGSSQTRTMLTHRSPVTITVRELGYACVRNATANGLMATAGLPVPIGNPAIGLDLPWTAPTIAGDFVFSVTSHSCNGGPTLPDAITVANSVLPPPPPPPGPSCRDINIGGAAFSSRQAGRTGPELTA